MNIKSEVKKIKLWTTDWVEQFVTTTLHLITIIGKFGNVKLGAFGTHLLEHFFGFVRRKSHDDHSHEEFLKVALSAVAEKMIADEFCINIVSKKRSSDSGCWIDQPQDSAMPLGSLLHTGLQFLELEGAVPDCEELRQIRKCDPFIEIHCMWDLIAVLPWTTKNVPKYISTSKCKLIAIGGLYNCMRQAAAGQISHMGEEFNEEED